MTLMEACSQARPGGLSTISNPSTPAYYSSPSPSIATKGDISVMRRGSLAITTERCRAMVAGTAMENAAVMGALWEKCYSVAPWGDTAYAQIYSAYADAAADAVRRF